jgi:hypothetical protein
MALRKLLHMCDCKWNCDFKRYAPGLVAAEPRPPLPIFGVENVEENCSALLEILIGQYQQPKRSEDTMMHGTSLVAIESVALPMTVQSRLCNIGVIKHNLNIQLHIYITHKKQCQKAQQFERLIEVLATTYG